MRLLLVCAAAAWLAATPASARPVTDAADAIKIGCGEIHRRLPKDARACDTLGARLDEDGEIWEIYSLPSADSTDGAPSVKLGKQSGSVLDFYFTQ